jgi:hypothetical protein
MTRWSDGVKYKYLVPGTKRVCLDLEGKVQNETCSRAGAPARPNRNINEEKIDNRHQVPGMIPGYLGLLA